MLGLGPPGKHNYIKTHPTSDPNPWKKIMDPCMAVKCLLQVSAMWIDA